MAVSEHLLRAEFPASKAVGMSGETPKSLVLNPKDLWLDPYMRKTE